VANNLNDISKNNPDIVVELVGKWMGKNTDTDKLVKHACRSLLKKARPEILDMFGLVEPNHLSVDDFRIQESVNVGDRLSFLFTLKSKQGRLGKLRIEYAIDFMKKDGRLSRKLFKISESNCSVQKKTIRKEHSFRIISTRKYYKGVHGFVLIVNGKELLSANFELRDR